MELKLVSEKDNPNFERRELVYEAPSAPTPSRAKAAEAISIAAKCPKDCVIVDRIDQEFGKRTVRVYAKVYKSADEARKNERKYKFARLERSAKKKEAAPAA